MKFFLLFTLLFSSFGLAEMANQKKADIKLLFLISERVLEGELIKEESKEVVLKAEIDRLNKIFEIQSIPAQISVVGYESIEVEDELAAPAIHYVHMINKDDGQLEEVFDLRKKYEADLVILIVDTGTIGRQVFRMGGSGRSRIRVWILCRRLPCPSTQYFIS